VPSGTLLNERGDEIPSPSQVYRTGMVLFAGNALEVRVMVNCFSSCIVGGVGEEHPARRKDAVRRVMKSHFRPRTCRYPA